MTNRYAGISLTGDKKRLQWDRVFVDHSEIRDGPLEKLWGGGEFSSCRNFFSLSNSLYEFFSGPCMNIS